MGLYKPLRYAILHVGASSMSITILEYQTIDKVKVIDYARREVTFGEELFQTNRLSFKTIEEICVVLKGYKSLMADYGISRYKLYGTAVVREAINRRSILDQIFIHTGMRVEVVDMPKEVYYKYFLLYFSMNEEHLLRDDEAVLFLEMSSGGVGLTVWKGGSMLFQRNVHSGSLRIMESFNRNERAAATFPTAVAEYIRRMISPLKAELQECHITSIVLSGDEARLIAKLMNYGEVSDATRSIDPQIFNDFFDSFHGVTATKLINRFHLPEFKAHILMPTIILHHELISMIRPKRLLMNRASFSEGISLYYGAEYEKHPYLHMLREQNIQLARAIAARYHTDALHDREVERFSLQFCQALTSYGLPERWAYLSRFAAILCSVGKYVSLRNHGEHSYHIIMGTDIFGLSEQEKEVVANVVYYHYKGTPSDDDDNFSKLTELQKIQVTKLVAIIRTACSLDAGSNQKVESIDIQIEDNMVHVIAYTQEDISLEEWIFKRDSEYFTEIFGMEIQLIIRRNR
ncbi:phosphatase [Veillonella montpellierensis]|uniref:Ppx/GppA phosphatase family protein n=1 Tax=Veillonella montpellierensis TaxID=187328 RepID=UPI0003FED468|nr:phosphatase [Veillonella montpellierensis]